MDLPLALYSLLPLGQTSIASDTRSRILIPTHTLNLTERLQDWYRLLRNSETASLRSRLGVRCKRLVSILGAGRHEGAGLTFFVPACEVTRHHSIRRVQSLVGMRRFPKRA
jgi:hypothetical protein